MSSYNIAVIYPSRGLLFTETLKEVLDELKPYKYKIFWSHGNKLPACFNKPVSRALRGNFTHILFLEDDMIIKKGILKQMLESDEDIIACDYPIAKCPSGTVLYDKDDNAIFTGTGFMLAKFDVIKKMPRPIFRSGLEWTFKQYKDKVKFTCQNCNPDKVYGHHDINFGLYQYVMNKPIKVFKEVLGQRKLKQKGDNANNIGTDDIEIWDDYKKINAYMIQEEIVNDTTDLLVEVKLDDKIVMMTKETADKLADKVDGKAGKLIKGNIIIDTGYNKDAIKYFKGETK